MRLVIPEQFAGIHVVRHDAFTIKTEIRHDDLVVAGHVVDDVALFIDRTGSPRRTAAEFKLHRHVLSDTEAPADGAGIGVQTKNCGVTAAISNVDLAGIGDGRIEDLRRVAFGRIRIEKNLSPDLLSCGGIQAIGDTRADAEVNAAFVVLRR